MMIGSTFHFEAAHSLPNHEGLCSKLHGHSYKLEVIAQGEINQGQNNAENGMVVDFSKFKAAINSILDEYDHCYLNDRLLNPTAEMLLFTLSRTITSVLDYLGIKLVSLKLWETEKNFVYWKAPE